MLSDYKDYQHTQHSVCVVWCTGWGGWPDAVLAVSLADGWYWLIIKTTSTHSRVCVLCGVHGEEDDQILCWLLGKSSREKTGNSLFFYQRGGTPPPFSGFGTFPVFSISVFFHFFLSLWNDIYGMKHNLYDMGLYWLWFMKTIYIYKPKDPKGSKSEKSNNISKWGHKGGGVIIGKNILLVYFMFQTI